MNPTHDQFSKRVATVRFVMGQAFEQHFVGKVRKLETAHRIFHTARRLRGQA